jgi:transposase-like protein
MSYCPYCGSSDLYELCIEKGESIYYCYVCHSCYNEPEPIPFDTFLAEVEQEFSEDAARLRNGERVDYADR